jgi:hypothetical protein
MMVHRIGKVDSLQEAELGCNTCTIEASVRIPVDGLILCEVVSVISILQDLGDPSGYLSSDP